MATPSAGDIDLAYIQALKCADSLVGFAATCKALRDSRDKWSREPLTGEEIQALREAAVELTLDVEVASRSVSEIEKVLHESSSGVVEIQGRKAASYIEAYVGFLSQKLADASAAMKPDADWLHSALHNLGNVGSWEKGQLKAHFDVERARVRALAPAEAKRAAKAVVDSPQDAIDADQTAREQERLDEVLNSDEWIQDVKSAFQLPPAFDFLSDRLQDLLVCLVKDQSRVVTYDTLAQEVWFNDDAETHAIQQAKSALVKALGQRGLGAVANRIRAKRGGYQFD